MPVDLAIGCSERLVRRMETERARRAEANIVNRQKFIV